MSLNPEVLSPKGYSWNWAWPRLRADIQGGGVILLKGTLWREKVSQGG